MPLGFGEGSLVDLIRRHQREELRIRVNVVCCEPREQQVRGVLLTVQGDVQPAVEQHPRAQLPVTGQLCVADCFHRMVISGEPVGGTAMQRGDLAWCGLAELPSQ